MAQSRDAKILEEAKDAFEVVEERESDNRDRMKEDLEFGRLGKQWYDRDIKTREQEGRPCLTINRMPTFIRQITNDARQNKPSIKVLPIDDDADPDTAEALGGVFRNIEMQSKSDLAFDTATDNAVSGGFGYIRVDVDYVPDSFDQDILINSVPNPLTVYGDPHDNGADSANWNTAFVTEMMKHSEFEREYSNAEEINWKADGNDDEEGRWIDEDQIRLAEYWRRNEVTKTLLKLSDDTVLLEDDYMAQDGAVKAIFDASGVTVVADRPVTSHAVQQFLMTGKEILETTEWAGKYIPLIPLYGDEVNVAGVRHLFSLIHFAKDAQRMFNYWRTTTTELVALAPKAPWVGPKGFAKSDRRWETANTDNHPYLEYDGQIPPVREPFAGIPAGALQEALNASDDMKSAMGIFDAAMGARSNETSGKAILARQRESDVSNFHFLDNTTRCVRHTGNVVLDLIPHVYSEPRIMRILGEDATPENIQINQPFPDPSGGKDESGNPITKIYDLTVGRYDVTVRAGPSFTTRREEAATQMTELLRNFPDAAPLIGDILAETLDWPRADEISKRLKALLPPGVRGGEEGQDEPNPEADALRAEMQQGIAAFQAQTEQLDGAHAQLGQLQSQIDTLQTKLENEAEKRRLENRKLDIEAYRAENEREAQKAEALKDRADAALKLQQAENEGFDKHLKVLTLAHGPQSIEPVGT